MSEMLIYLDGELVPREAAKVSVFDHGLLYGDGVFEGIRVYNRRIFRLDAHLDRLYDSARALALAIPLARAELAEAVRAALDLAARHTVAMHWGTFDLTDEPPDEPPRRFRAAAEAANLGPDRAWVLAVGETRRW